MPTLFSTGVFSERRENSLSEAGFYALLSFFIFCGLGATAFAANMAIEVDHTPGILEIIILGLIVPLIGIWLADWGDHPVFTFVGYFMIAIPFGIILGPVLNKYSGAVVERTFEITGCITLFMGLAGVLFPALFRNLGSTLFLSLGGLLIVRVLQLFIPALAQMHLVDYIAVGIFSLYIGYDMYRASSVGRTVDSAIDIAIHLYLDIINLFINLIGIISRSEDQ